MYYGDNLTVMQDWNSKMFDFIYTDPPYNSDARYNLTFAPLLEANEDYLNLDAGLTDAAQDATYDDIWKWTELSEDYYKMMLAEQQEIIIETSRLLYKKYHGTPIGSFLMFMYPRLLWMYRSLKRTGVLMIHVDSYYSHHLHIMLESIFGEGRRVATFRWKRHNAKSSITRHPGNTLDDILCYSVSDQYTFNPRIITVSDEDDTRFPFVDERGRWASDPMFADGKRKGDSGLPWREIDPNQISAGLHWRVRRQALPEDIKRQFVGKSMQECLEILDENGFIYWSENQRPRFKRYAQYSDPPAIQDLITDIKPIGTGKEDLGFATAKPVALMERFIKAFTNPGDLVGDPFNGSGSTTIAALRLNRRAAGIDITTQSMFMTQRRILNEFGDDVNITISGIPRDMIGVDEMIKKDRHEFERQIVQIYTNNHAETNLRKGADGGVDGKSFFRIGAETQKLIHQVKSGKSEREDVSSLLGVMARENATLGVLYVRNPPTKAMLEETHKAGYVSINGVSIKKVQIVTAEEVYILGNRLVLPWVEQDNTKNVVALPKSRALEFFVD